jgi:hypothetical protein
MTAPLRVDVLRLPILLLLACRLQCIVFGHRSFVPSKEQGDALPARKSCGQP